MKNIWQWNETICKQLTCQNESQHFQITRCIFQLQDIYFKKQDVYFYEPHTLNH